MKIIIMMAIALLTGMAMQAQDTPVSFNGSKPVITDFVTAALQRDGDEFIRGAQENWTLRQQGKPLDDGASYTVDVKNGFVRFDKRYTANTYSYVEFCFWNCANQREKIVAVNSGCVEQGVPVTSEFTTLKFYGYDNEKGLCSGCRARTSVPPSMSVPRCPTCCRRQARTSWPPSTPRRARCRY